MFLNSFSFLDPFMLFVSLKFDYFLFLIIAVLYYYRGREQTILFLVLLVSAWSLALALKPIFEVPRPEDVRFVTCTTGYSMPSGHSLMSFALATFLHSRAGKFKLLVWIFAITVSLSRIFIGVHYPSDVIVGALIGCIVGFFWLYVEKALVKYGLYGNSLESRQEGKEEVFDQTLQRP
ncbi:phosphatase PAP2 family protein [Methanosarcina sp. WH1]|uniref:phosphatase PAP2 family protein n=2 Tax=unclassified Methanosarcina TaxID=2644672 RepID=UPI0006161D2B|nr:phosphatase PAP2 family protein [Methanosarcina sp. WH1]AKB17465.1 Membrane-associated phospholipid phosphatase [Methanosarcina sp. WWM596]